MLHNRAIKMRIYPNDEQRYKIDVTLSYCRYIYNKMLERNTVIYKRRREHLNYYAMQNLLPEMKDYLPWLKEADSQALKYACRQLNTAFEKFYQSRSFFFCRLTAALRFPIYPTYISSMCENGLTLSTCSFN